MKIREGFVSNSSSASFIVGIPSKDKNAVLKTLFQQFEYDLFGKYYLKEAIKKNLSFAEKSFRDATDDYETTAKIPKEERLEGKNMSYDPLSWKLSTMKQWERSYEKEKSFLKRAEDLDKKSETALVELGLEYYSIYFHPTYSEKGKKILKKLSKKNSSFDFGSPEKIKILLKEEIIGYQLEDFVTMFNDFYDIPRTLRSIAGLLAFVYPDLKCWVEEDGD